MKGPKGREGAAALLQKRLKKVSSGAQHVMFCYFCVS